MYQNKGIKDMYKISNGNLKVLETIPYMMREKKWRKKIRMLVLDFIFDKEITKQMARKIFNKEKSKIKCKKK